ncbi:hypothetical protein I8748_32100 [Nostoc sp. CENA67]|uniref:Uncharacterized protein n=1 Tax=Amazonocrinis nigriterrae CENA67 TaxID=2794033 RepID=A0A8J7HVP8_9NOST|nr:hypothetical protein [Amazonocrinis nigriterrae]MBH8566742.1 hypothetical protein [Amazonocrinis nigriterrae CENA67]
MTSPPTPKEDSRIGKGYSYLFASVLTALLVGQTIDISFKTDKSGDFAITLQTREINLQIFYPCVGLIAGILGLPTDAIALSLGKFLSKGRE